ncbi:RNF219 [Branchiostoma lanceolatum]|uniref:RNF219 protein n=1 Tax=Branchiostoma lanceolatum TaxID=7740 RepID=A0A8K0A3M2_BRALA|nr:RNF219 [Branchiostoma lanceolatum]
MADRSAVQTATFAFTLPISCQICLGKVKQPVVCPNQHVFCQQCMDVWLMHNQQCPTCRVEISINNPCKRVLGGLSGGEETSDRDSFSTKEVRKARLDVIFNEYEREIERLQSLVEDLSKKNEFLKHQVPNQASTSSTKTQKNKGSDVDKLLQLTSKLQDATSTYEAVVRDMTKLKEENSILREKNSDLSRMNEQLRMELNKRTPQKYGRYTVATLEAKVAQYEKENGQLQRALERSDKNMEELEKQLENCKKNHSLQNEQRTSRERSKSKSPEFDGEERRPAERKWNQEKLDHSKERHVSVSSSEQRLPDPKLSPVSQTLQFLRNPAGGSNDLVPSWLRTDQNWPGAESEQAEGSRNQQGDGDSFVLEQPSPLTPATHMKHLSIGHKSERLPQNRTDTHTSYKNEDTYVRRAESHGHYNKSSNNTVANISYNQHGGNHVNSDRSARFPSPTGQSDGSVTSSGKARRRLHLGNDAEKVRKSLFPSRETNEGEQSFGRYTSQEVRDTSNSSNTGSWTDRASTSYNNWKQDRSGNSGKRNDLDMYDMSPDAREKSGQLANRAHGLPSEQFPKNYSSLVERDREASILPGPSRTHASASLDGQDNIKRKGKSFQWQAESEEGSDDEDKEVASTTANQSLLDLDITLTPNMKDVYLMMKQAERRVGERREADAESSGQLHSSHDAGAKTKHFHIHMPQETTRQKTGAHFQSKQKMPRSSSAPVLESTDIPSTGNSGNFVEKSARRRNMSHSSSSWQSNGACGTSTNNVHDYGRGLEQRNNSYTTDKDKLTRNRSWDVEHATTRHTEANANSHPWAFRDSSSSFSTAQGNHTFSRSRVAQEQTQVPEIKKAMHPTMFECFGEGSSSGDRSTDSDRGRYQYSGLLDRESEGENFKKRKARESYPASPTKSPKWK